MPDKVICTIDQHTRVAEVLAALDQPGKTENLKVKGRYVPDGSGAIELYWTSKRSSLKDRLSKRAAEQRELARRAFKQIQKNERHYLREESCRLAEHHIQALSTLLCSAGYDKMRHGHSFNKHANARALKSHQLFAQLKGLQRLCEEAREESKRFQPAVDWCNRLPTLGESEPGRPILRGLTHQKILQAGGFGDLHVYGDGKGQQYAVKVIRPRHQENDSISTKKAKDAEDMHDFMHECQALGSARARSPREIVKLVEALRTDTGKLVLVMEYAPYGDLDHFINKTLKNAKEEGLDDDSIDRIKSMILRDVFTGVRAAHRAGVIHGDLKPANIVIGDGGVAKITDFGTAQTGGKFAPSQSPPVDNPRWSSPEILVLKEQLNKIDDLTELTGKYEDFYKRQLDIGTRGATKILDALTSNARDRAKAEMKVGPEADLWAVGVIAFNLAYGRDMYENDARQVFDHEITERALAFTGAKLAVGYQYDDGSFVPGHFMAEDGGNLAGTVNRLLDPDHKERRKSLGQLLDEWPSEEELGGQETRDLIMALASGRWFGSQPNA